MTILYVALASFFLLYLLWLYYLAVMSLKGARDNGRLTAWGKFFGYPILFTGYVIDIVANLTVMTLLMVELPHEFVVTERVARHLLTGAGYRYAIAKWFCSNLLDPYDPSGCHCK